MVAFGVGPTARMALAFYWLLYGYRVTIIMNESGENKRYILDFRSELPIIADYNSRLR